jgi:hypothetical protein
MNLRYAGTCRECGQALAGGTRAVYDGATRTVSCVQCPSATTNDTDAVEATDSATDPTPTPTRALDRGIAGASAQRRYELLSDRREKRIRENHPRLGGILLALSDEPQRITAWQKGARGETILGRRLDTLTEQGVQVLHDRRIPGTKANIDYIAVGPRGVFVIDAKRYTGAPSLRVSGGLFEPRRERLMVGTRDCTQLVGGIHRQVSLVETALEAAGFTDIPVFGMLCFVEADWPLLGVDFLIDDVEVLWPKRAAKRITAPGSFDADAAARAARALEAHFPRA